MEIRRLNTLRGIAALIVVISHYSNESGILGGFLGRGAGQFGVMLFFMLSGFLMSFLYLSEKFVSSNVCRYAVARVARVLPLYLIVVLSSYGLLQMGIGDILYPIAGSEQLFSHLAFLFGVSVLWTIPVEIQFYLLFILMWWIWARKGTWLFVIIAVALVVLFTIGTPQFKGELAGIPYNVTLLFTLPYFLVGLYLGRIYPAASWSSRYSSRYFAFTLLLIPLLYPKVFSALTGIEHGLWREPGILLAMAVVFFSVLFLVPEECRLLANSVGDFLGKVSYSLYLLHIPVLSQIKDLVTDSPWLALGVFLPLSLCVAFLSFQLIETPLRIAIRKLIARRSLVTA